MSQVRYLLLALLIVPACTYEQKVDSVSKKETATLSKSKPNAKERKKIKRVARSQERYDDVLDVLQNDLEDIEPFFNKKELTDQDEKKMHETLETMAFRLSEERTWMTALNNFFLTYRPGIPYLNYENHIEYFINQLEKILKHYKKVQALIADDDFSTTVQLTIDQANFIQKYFSKMFRNDILRDKNSNNAFFREENQKSTAKSTVMLTAKLVQMAS